MGAALLFRRCYGERDTAKKAARGLKVSLSTAKRWIIEGPPAARRAEVVAAMRAELDRRLEEMAEAEAELARLTPAAFPRLTRRG